MVKSIKRRSLYAIPYGASNWTSLQNFTLILNNLKSSRNAGNWS